MTVTSIPAPEYAQSFQCIGSLCEDTCCQGFSVPIDAATHAKYASLPAGPLRTLIDASMLMEARPAQGSIPASVAVIRMNEAHQCPMQSKEGLCRIQSELGEDHLSHICATYPRIVYSVNGLQQQALTLSCPEAARLVLLNPALPARHSFVGSEINDFAIAATGLDAQSRKEPGALLPHFLSIQASVLALIRNRSYPLWQRLFLLGVFCRRIDSILKGELQRPVAAFIHDFDATVTTGALRTAMEALPIDRAAQLDVVLRLAGLMLHRSNVRPRFVECVQAFTAGIGNQPNATLQTLTGHYANAHDGYYAPFFERHPHILENYLINTVFRRQFPLGREALESGATPSLEKQYALLTAQFALIKGLLIGVAGHHRAAFNEAHVVHTVQSASKHFEHHPEFLNHAYNLLVESQMDGARGLAILLRNTEPPVVRTPGPEIHTPQPQAS